MSEGLSTLEISKELSRDHWTMKKPIKDITKSRTRSKRKGSKNLFPRDERKLKRVITKQSFLSSAQIFEKAGVKPVNKDKKCRIVCELESVKTFSRQPSLTKANILKRQNRTKKYIKIDFYCNFYGRITSDI